MGELVVFMVGVVASLVITVETSEWVINGGTWIRERLFGERV